MSIADVYREVSDNNLLRRPEPMRSNPTKRNQNKYCRYHGNHGHATAECIDLKDEIERLIRDGRLQEYKAERQGQQRERRRIENRPQEPVGVIRTIYGGPYFGGHSVQISFSEEDAAGVHFPHNDALVMAAVISNHTVCRILVDNESSVDILYSDCLKKMGIDKS